MGIALEIIQWFDQTGEQIIHRIPEDGSTDIKLGAQLIVRESQKAVFFRDGKALDVFDAGRHTLATLNLPILTRLLSLPFGFKSPFQAEVIFINMKDFIGQKWGTPTPVTFRDSEFKMIRLRAFGIFNIKVSDPLLFVNGIVGTKGIYTTEALNQYLREVIISRFNDLLGETMQTILDLPKYYDELASQLKDRIGGEFKKIGITLIELLINAITPTEEVQKMIDERSGMSAIGDLNAFLKYKTAKAVETAAANPAEGGAGAAGMTMGMGAGVGFMIPEMLKQAERSGSDSRQSVGAAENAGFCSKCGAPLIKGGNFCSKCGAKIENKTILCPKCNAANQPLSNFCAACGEKLAQ